MTRYDIALSISLICALLTTLTARAVTVPNGTALRVHTLNALRSNDKIGKKFAARLDSDIVVKGRVTAPAGSTVYGRVESSGSAGQSKLELSLTQIIVNGRPVAIATESYEESGLRSGRTTAGRATAEAKIGATVGGTAASYAIGVLGTAIGAALRVPAAGAAIGTLGAAFGAPAAGAAIGTATGQIGQSKSMFPAGTQFEFRLARPVSL